MGNSLQGVKEWEYILSPEAAKAWRDGGEQWEPVSPRIVTARLRVDSRGKHHRHIHLISVYAPTFHAPQQVKDDFYADVQMVLDKAPEKDILVILGDWNARVGSQHVNHQWQGCWESMDWGVPMKLGYSFFPFVALIIYQL